jgi:aryl-alcohol dehydrogenase-like predicted oxidoreductase
MGQCEASLRRLGTDYIDLYQCHRYDTETPLEETLRALDDLITQGKVLYAGISNWTAVQIDDAIHTTRSLNLDPIVSDQPRYNLLARDIERDVLSLCEREGIGLVVYSPLAQGVLTGKYKPGQQPTEGTRAANEKTNMFMHAFLTEQRLNTVQRLQELAQEAGYTLSQLALAWVLRHSIISSAIIGASRPEQIEENIKASEIKLTDDVLLRIEEILATSGQ